MIIMASIPVDAKNGFWLVLGGMAALVVAAYVLRRFPL